MYKYINYILLILSVLSFIIIAYAQLGQYLINKDYYYPEKCDIVTEIEPKVMLWISSQY